MVLLRRYNYPPSTSLKSGTLHQSQICFEYNLHSAIGLNSQGRPIIANGANTAEDKMAR